MESKRLPGNVIIYQEMLTGMFGRFDEVGERGEDEFGFPKTEPPTVTT